MRIHKRLAALMLTGILCCAFAVTAYAHPVPDMDRAGSVHGTMVYDGSAVGGGTLTLYQVGDVSEDDGDYSFTLSNDFAGSQLSLADMADAELAAGLADYAADNSLAAAATAAIDSDGTVDIQGLYPGLYLVVQTMPAEGFEAISPFLVSLPVYNGEIGAYIYDVNVEPKMSPLIKKPTPDTTTPDTTTPETKKPESTGTTTVLPQTGQLNWPVPVLTVLGLCLFGMGWMLHFGRRKKPDEA